MAYMASSDLPTPNWPKIVGHSVPDWLVPAINRVPELLQLLKSRDMKADKLTTVVVQAVGLQKLKATPDGDGTLLDNTVYLYGSGMGNPSLHDHVNLPILVAGGARFGMQGGRHLRYKTGKPLANLHVTLLDKVGVHLDKFGDSDGKIENLFEAVAV